MTVATFVGGLFRLSWRIRFLRINSNFVVGKKTLGPIKIEGGRQLCLETTRLANISPEVAHEGGCYYPS